MQTSGGAGKKTFIDLPVSRLRLSRFNPRRQRPPEYVDRLAQRIRVNGYELTRALWVYPQDGDYEVFAGGTRLAAAKLAGLASVPVVLHEGFTFQQIAKLADEDNENDEYHAPVPVVDMWLEYRRLKDEEGWDVETISQAKGVRKTLVYDRLTYAQLPASVLAAFSANDCLKESHAAELCKIPECGNLAPWMNREQAMLNILKKILERYLQPTAKNFAHQIERQSEVVILAESYRDNLEACWQASLLTALAHHQADTKADVEDCYAAVVAEYTEYSRQQEETARRALAAAEQERVRVEQEKRQAAERKRLLSKLVCGDSRQTLAAAPHQVRLLLTDPPYGLNYQNNPKVTHRKPLIANDDHQAPALLTEVLTLAYPKLANDAFVLVWVDWKHFSQFEQVVKTCGYTIRSVIVWDKPNGGRGDCEGAPAPKHEWCIFAVKGNPKLNFRFTDVLQGHQFLGSDHPTEKPLDLLQTLIKATTQRGDCVLDPFAGVGSVPVTAYRLGRDFWACELDFTWHSQAREFLLGAMQPENHRLRNHEGSNSSG